ncbi:GNAT family N-acetyltransferase [Streptomyces mirabilis]|uniref:GNAT family N-acetyltransferase n=1 Tax=Streptomyces mirabilis TaxID=68239 RepID=UPI003677FA55
MCRLHGAGDRIHPVPRLGGDDRVERPAGWLPGFEGRHLDQFADLHKALPAEQEADTCACYVLVAEDGSVLGRFNLVNIEDRTAELGYRVAQHVAGRGVATATVRNPCQLAATRHGLRTLRAATARENAASQKVLTKAGFVPVGPADPADVGGGPGTRYERHI